jgi:uncharacterized RDD family membrane protein YckC
MAYQAPPQYPPAPPPPPQGAPYAPYGYGWLPALPGPAPGLRYAGFWIRFAAYLIDSVIMWIPLGIIFAVAVAPTLPSINCTFVNTTGFQSATCSGIGPLFASLSWIWLVSLLLPAVYSVVLWTWQGQTVGQKILGLRVVDSRTGQHISEGRAIGRYIGLIISSWVLFIGLIWAAFDPQKQGWHDKMASTFVVRRA